MFRGNIISVDTPDNHSIFMNLLRNELETMLNTMLVAIIRVTLERDIINVLYILFSVKLPLKYLAIDWGNFKINYSHCIIETLVILKK